MSAAVQERIFEPFFTTKGLTEGTGLGLAICYGVVQQLGGRISVDSKLGQGTTFTIDLPEYVGELPLDAEEIKTIDAPSSGETILVVEDDAAIRRATQRTLRSRGYEVLIANDGIEGVEVFSANQDRIALVLTDVVMPHSNGFALAKEVRRICPQVGIILTSGYADSQVNGEDIAEEILWKPYEPDDLVARIRNCLDKASKPAKEEPIAANATILIIDDEEHIRKALRRILEVEGYKVDVCSSVGDARIRIGKTPSVSIVLCDLHVGSESGLDLLRWIECDTPQLASKFMVITGGTSGDELQAFAKENSERIVRKPFRIPELLKRVSSLLEGENR